MWPCLDTFVVLNFRTCIYTVYSVYYVFSYFLCRLLFDMLSVSLASKYCRQKSHIFEQASFFTQNLRDKNRMKRGVLQLNIITVLTLPVFNAKLWRRCSTEVTSFRCLWFSRNMSVGPDVTSVLRSRLCLQIMQNVKQECSQIELFSRQSWEWRTIGAK
jgi:hypothetical protein